MDQQRRVLVIDDDPEIARMMSVALAPHGLSVDGAADGEQSLAFLRENIYVVVLLDLMMPALDGFGVLNALQGPDIQSPPVVLVVTGADRNLIDQLDPQRIHGIVRKPFDPQDLALLVVACSEIKSRGSFGTMALATVIGGAQLLAWLVKP
jgi:two-component system, OmpR family, response regulator CiaR